MISISRRRLLSATALAGSALMFQHALAKRASADDLHAHLVALEKASGGRLGVAVLDVDSGARLAYRADERFPMCSTFKVLVAGFVLARVDRDEETLVRRIEYTRADLVAHSPVTEKHVERGSMSVAELCHATVTTSDNAAANLLLKSFGGPAGLTAWLRSVGDSVTRSDRYEPALNEGALGDPRDTSSPTAMLATLRQLLLGDVLSQPSREQLTAWLIANTTGDTRLRAGLPLTWRVGDKTGAADGISNDVAIVWPPSRGPLLITAYYAESNASFENRNRVIADVGRIAASLIVS